MSPYFESIPRFPTDIILENLLDAVMIVDRKGIILYANKSAGNIFNKPASLLIGENFGFPVTPFEVQEIEVIRREKILTIQMLASLIDWKSVKAYLLSLRDISKLKKVENELITERKKLEITNLENEQYASLASHDLKEPVRKIMIYSDWLLTSAMPALEENIRERVYKILHSAQRMQSLMNGIADYSRLTKQTTAFIQLKLNDIVKDVCQDLELIIRENNARIRMDDLPEIMAIPVQMHQLFLNLISNSIKYAKTDTSPEINISCRELSDNRLELTFADNGIGFDNKYAKQIFQPFSRLHSRNYEGSGIGLAICKKIVEAHGGTIMAVSIPNEGTKFIFSLLKFPEVEDEKLDFGE